MTIHAPLTAPDATHVIALDAAAVTCAAGARRSAGALYRAVRDHGPVAAALVGHLAARAAARSLTETAVERLGLIPARAGAPGAADADVVFEAADAHAVVTPQPAPSGRMRVALAGCGVVGAGVAKRLADESDRFELVGVLVRDLHRPRDVVLPHDVLTDDDNALFAAQPDVLIDALSSGTLGATLSARALEAGVSVVSANKQALAETMAELNAKAAGAGATLAYSAAVGGGCPMIETMRRARALGPIAGFEAVLNGTVNFILGQLAQGRAFDDALSFAQRQGFAEADASADLDGLDAQAKVRILGFEAWGETPSADAVPCDRLAADVDMSVAPERWKQLGAATLDDDGAVRAGVRLGPVLADPLWAGATNERNALRVQVQGGPTLTARGAGAGRWPTTEAIMADLFDLAAIREAA